MTGLLATVLVVLALAGGLVEFSILAARRIERAVPPQGVFLDVDGERLHMFDVGRGPPIVMIHGLGGQMGNFTHSLVDRLRDDFRVVAFDRPGSGYSTRPPGAPAGVRAQAAVLAKAIRVLRLDRPVIVGHSLGGAVALALALDHPECVGALALVSPATHPVAAPPRVFRGLAIRSPFLRRVVAWTLATPGGLLARNWTVREVFAPRPPPSDFATAGGGLLGLRPRNVYASSTDMMAATGVQADVDYMTQRYASLRMPIGILYGRDDRILDYREQGEAMKQKIAALDLEIVPGGHMLPVTQPDVAARFIRRIAARRTDAAEAKQLA